MKRSVQEIVELLVFGLIALLIGTGLLWLAGWVFDLVGVLFKFFAALIWSLLRFIVPVAVGAAIVYALVRLIQQQREKGAAEKSRASSEPGPSASIETGAAPPTGGSSATLEPTSTTPSTVVPPPTAGQPAERSEEGESHPTASEVWVPPQPSPPTSSTETLDEPGPVEDQGPIDDAAPVDAPLDPETTGEEWAGSVPAADDEPEHEERLDETPFDEPGSPSNEDDDRRS